MTQHSAGEPRATSRPISEDVHPEENIRHLLFEMLYNIKGTVDRHGCSLFGTVLARSKRNILTLIQMMVIAM